MRNLEESDDLNAVGNKCPALQLQETFVLHDFWRTKENTNIKIVEGVVLLLKESESLNAVGNEC